MSLTPAVAASAFDWSSGDHHLALTTADGDVVWQFNYPPAPAKPHFHPVALPGHQPLTGMAPPDHPWHLGFWFSWKFINGQNYWETDPSGRSEGLTRVLAVKATPRSDASARIDVALAYQPSSDADAVLRESRTVEVSAPADDGSYRFDWTMTFTAGSEAVRLDRTPTPDEPDGKPWGGYAGLTWRFAREFDDWRAVNSTGLVGAATHGQSAPATDFSGQLEGVAMGVAMFEHSENPSAPTPWYVSLDRATPFACLMPAPLFGGPITLQPRESFTLRYRVIVHPGRWNAARLNREAEAFVTDDTASDED